MSTDASATARSFMAHRAGGMHPSWDTTICTYDPLQDRYELNDQNTTIRQVAVPYTERFLKVMETFRLEHKDNTAVAEFDIRGAHSWKEVLDVANQASDKYESGCKGLRGLLPRVGRKIGEANPSIDTFLTSLPQGDYSAVVTGAVLLLFRATGRMADIRQRVLATLSDAPELLEQTETFLRLYPNDKRLNEKAIQLYIALVVAIEGMVSWFDHGIRDRIKVFALQGLYGRDLDAKIRHMHKCAASLREQAEMCDKHSTVQIYEAMKYGVAQLYAINGGIEDVKTEIQDLRAINAAHTDQMSSIERGVNALLQQLQGEHINFEWQCKMIELRSQAEARAAYLEGQNQLLQVELQRALTPTSTMSRSDILHALGVNGDELSADITHYIVLARDHDSSTELTETIMTSPTFRHWFASSKSQLLVVKTDLPPSKISPLTSFSASLLQALSGMQPATRLGFFCDRHTTNPALQGPGGLMTSLCAQFLTLHQKTDLSPWLSQRPENEHLEFLHQHHVHYLCDFFAHLITSLPYGTIFLTIDNFRALETTSTVQEISALISFLHDLVAFCQRSGRIILKFMILGPDMKGQLRLHTPMQDVLLVQSSLLSRGSTSPLMPKAIQFHMTQAQKRTSLDRPTHKFDRSPSPYSP